jgi:hypothetical protein
LQNDCFASRLIQFQLGRNGNDALICSLGCITVPGLAHAVEQGTKPKLYWEEEWEQTDVGGMLQSASQ